MFLQDPGKGEPVDKTGYVSGIKPPKTTQTWVDIIMVVLTSGCIQVSLAQHWLWELPNLSISKGGCYGP